jgi:TolB-like protein/Tfp pilus assembly protein PilF
MERRLTSILAADVVGYSSQMEAAEERTAEDLERRQAQIAATAERLGGRVFNTAGDSALAEFVSPVNAVRCGVEIQQSENGGRHLPLRVGVHMADVIVSGNDLIGDGVNVAARIQEVAEPKSVLASAALFEQVKRQSPYTFEDLGPHSLKNISEQIRLYRVAGVMKTHSFGHGHLRADPKAKSLRPESLAVLPFEVSQSDEEQQLFADGLTEELIIELSRHKRLFVTARSASAEYKTRRANPKTVARELGVEFVLSGRLRKLGGRVRVSTHLASGESGEQIWAERFDRPWDELFELLDELVARIAATTVGQVETAAIAAARRKRPEVMTAYEFLLRGLECHRRGGVTLDNSREAAMWFERSIKADPDYGLAYAWNVCAASWLPDFDEEEGFCKIQRALELDENEPEIHRIMGSFQMMYGDFEKAEYHHLRAIELNPSHAYIKCRTAALYTFKGVPERALELVAEAEALDPFLPVWCIEEKGVALYAAGRYEDAISALGALAFQTARSKSYEAACRQSLGDHKRAEAAIRTALGMKPELTATGFLATESYRSEETKARLRALLEAAGLPA